MNFEHLNEIELKQYGESNLSPREFLHVQTHLETCEECQRRLDEMFPKIAEREEALLIEDLQADVKDDFHLNYDEHLKPFIYETISAIDKEIVESHVEVCAVCREDLRDLLNFHRELEQEKEIREFSKSGFWATVSNWFSTPNRKAVWLTFASVMILVSAGLVWFFALRPANEIVQTPANSGENAKNQTVPIVNQMPIETNQNANTPKTNQSNAQNQNADLPEKVIEMAALVLPKFLNDLRINESETLRGNNDSETQKIAVISPNGKVIRDSSPILSWQNVANIETYEVTVFDENDNRIAKIESVKNNSWRVANLPKGKIYQWQVSAKKVSKDGKTTNYLGKGKFYIVGERDENKIIQAQNALEKGKAFAEAGLLTEAETEFRQYLKQNPNSENAKKFLRQVQQAQR
ncbi:hypothetical protein BH20ACI4_BH20ACI4_01520 [soil metagenome]